MIEEEEQNKKNKVKTSKLLRIIIAGVAIVVVGLLIYFRSKNPETFTLVWVIIPVAVLVIVVVFAFFGKTISKFAKGLLEKTDKSTSEKALLSEPLKDSELFEIARNIIRSEDYENHIKKFGSTFPISFGKNLIKAIICELLYEHKGSYECMVLINTQDVKRYNVLFEGDARITEAKVKACANALSVSPEGEPDIKETEEENILTGAKRKTKETTHPKKKKKEEEGQET